MSDWKTVGWDELSHEEPKRVNQGHAFDRPKAITWPSWCRHCGHVPLKNDISKLVTKIGCNYEKDARFKQWRARLNQ